MRIRKAFLLAAGLGTRLRPITYEIPKCLVEINGIPLLAWWIKLFERHNIEEVLINLHHLPGKVRNFINNYNTSIKFKLVEEKYLLGSAGTLKANADFVDDAPFLIAYADNLTNFNITKFAEFHNAHPYPFSMALFETDTPTAKGIVELDENNVVISFEEKPENPKSNLANAGIYIAEPEIIKLIDKEIADIGFDLLPKLVGKMKGFYDSYYLLDIGTHKHLEQANKEWKNYYERSEL
jgi:mannose-1-phosphate guanylyltransferase